MADEDPSATGEPSALPKKETVRITLPPNPSDTPMVKRETVRINTPGPKKETTNIGGATPLPATPPPAPAGGGAPTRPLAPPPSAPRPPGAPGLSGAGRPSMPPPSAPRPPGAPAAPPKPGLPPTGARPPGAPVAPAPVAEAKPVSIKAAPKKETARIQVAPTAKLPPQATVRLNQPPSSGLASGPASAIRTTAPAVITTEVDEENDPMTKMLSIAAVVLSLVAAALSYLAYSA